MRYFLIVLVFAIQTVQADNIRVSTITNALIRPWSITLVDDDIAYVTEKEGSLKRVSLLTGLSEPIQGTPEVYTQGQAGLLGSVLHPNFAVNQWIYLSYVKPMQKGQSTTAVVRYRIDGNRLVDEKAIFEAAIESDDKGHFGSRLVFDNQGLLYITLGDRHNRPAVQSLNAHNGKIIRLNDDGSIPEANPFVTGNPVAQAIFSLGHRNVQGLAKRSNGQIWASEHGPRGGDEINLLSPGKNYGWPVITYGKEYVGGSIGEGTAKEGMEQPKHYYVPSIATSDMVFYAGEEFPEWQDNILLTSLAGQHLNRLILDGDEIVDEQRHLTDLNERLRDIAVDSRGKILLLTDSGKILRLEKG